jgi:stage V sporulation protein D (sporulation-specific penicillin-binding protein)
LEKNIKPQNEKNGTKENKQLSEVPGKWMKRKLYWIVTVLLLAFAVYVGQTLYLTAVVNSEHYRMRANNQQLDGFEINANRGTIFDRNGKILAKSTTVWSVIISPYDITYNDKCLAELCPECSGESCSARIERICTMLSDVLEIDYDKLLEICNNPDNRYEIIKKRVSKEVHDEINRNKAEKGIGHYSVYLVEDTKRSYPNNELASNIVGFTDYDNIGQYGVEAYYDEYLQGLDGRLVMLKDGAGRTMSSEFERRFDAVDGNDLYMTIDVVLQHYLEKNLETIVNQHNVANRATGIMMDPNTGAILAMATTLGFNLNDPTDLSDKDEEHLEKFELALLEETRMETVGELTKKQRNEIKKAVQNERARLWEIQWRNKAITELYYPGSVFKTITAAAALEEKAVTLGSDFYCSGGSVVNGVEIGCWRSWGHGSLDLTGALIHSCNPAFINIGDRLGVQRFYDYLEAFGLTKETGIDIPAEAYPIVTKRNQMSPVDLATSSFGQTNKITPLQMITAFAACVNGGYLVTPHVMDKITDNDGNVVKNSSSGVRRQILSKETSDAMKHILEEVVKFNGGNNAYISGFRIGGKSGTSQKLDEYPEDDSMRYVASFCAFAPADNPKVIMLVAVDEPNPGGEPYYGSMVAAPVVSAVFKESFQHLEIYPQFTAEEQALQDTVVPPLVGLSRSDVTMRLNAAGLNANFIGEGNRILRTIPDTGSPIRNGSTVVLYTEEQDAIEVTVPDVYGMTVPQATQVITNAGLNIRLSGGSAGNETAVAVFMSVDPDTRLRKGTVIDVQFAVNEGHGG